MLLLDCSRAKVPEEGLLSQKILKIPEALCRAPFLSVMFLPLRESPRSFVTAGMVPVANSLQLDSISYVRDKYVRPLSRLQLWTTCGMVIRGQGKKETAVGNLRTLMVAPCCPTLIFSHAFPTSPLLQLELLYHHRLPLPLSCSALYPLFSSFFYCIFFRFPLSMPCCPTP